MFNDIVIVNASPDEFNKLPNSIKVVHNVGLLTNLVKWNIIESR